MRGSLVFQVNFASTPRMSEERGRQACSRHGDSPNPSEFREERVLVRWTLRLMRNDPFFWRREAGTTAAFPGTFASYVARSCEDARCFRALAPTFLWGGIAWLSRCDVVGIHVDKIVRNRRHPRMASFRRRSRAFPPSPNVATAEAVALDLRNRAVATAREVRVGGFPPRSFVGTPRVVSSKPRTPPGTGRVDGGRPWDVFGVSWTNQSTVWIPAG